MGKNKETEGTLKGLSGLDYVEVRHVPMTHYADLGEAVHSKTLGEIEKAFARELIVGRYNLRGQEVKFLRSLLGFSQRQLAEKLKLSHVSILKWEKAAAKPLDLVNEVSLKALLSGFLRLKVPASLETLTGDHEIPKRMVLDYSEDVVKARKKTA